MVKYLQPAPRVNVLLTIDIHSLKAIESNMHGKIKRNQFSIEHLGIQRLVVVIFNKQGDLGPKIKCAN